MRGLERLGMEMKSFKRLKRGDSSWLEGQRTEYRRRVVAKEGRQANTGTSGHRAVGSALLTGESPRLRTGRVLAKCRDGVGDKEIWCRMQQG